jgi:hypothetical protein
MPPEIGLKSRRMSLAHLDEIKTFQLTGKDYGLFRDGITWHVHF